MSEFTVEKVVDKNAEFQHVALGIYKDKAKGLWQVVRIGFNVDGTSGDMKVIYESGFRDEANEAFRINVSKLGMLG